MTTKPDRNMHDNEHAIACEMHAHVRRIARTRLMEEPIEVQKQGMMALLEEAVRYLQSLGYASSVQCRDAKRY